MKCLHPIRELRKKRNLMGVWVVAEQCDSCGRNCGKVEPGPFSSVHDFPMWQARKRPNSRKRRYHRYLQSPEWKRKRAEVLARDNWECQWPGCTAEATQVDHITYDRLYAERLEDLRGVCEFHNQAEREVRVLRGVMGT